MDDGWKENIVKLAKESESIDYHSRCNDNFFRRYFISHMRCAETQEIIKNMPDLMFRLIIWKVYESIPECLEKYDQLMEERKRND